MSALRANPRTTQIVLAFAIVYLVWGSTYLAIRIGVSALPPALFAGARFLVAGLLLLAYAYWRGARLPKTAADWRRLAVTGVLMLVGGNGLVTWSEQWVESNQAALIIATSALWLAAMGAMGARGDRVGRLAGFGLLLGFGGVAMLVEAGLDAADAPLLAYAALIASPILWASGSVYSRRHPVGTRPLMSAALQMLIASAVFLAVGLAAGEQHRWSWDADAMAALGYLIVFGSCIAYGAYSWLVHEVTPAQLGTYAYVNPAVAVVLGWWLLDETLSPPQVLGTVVILGAVMIVTWAAGRGARS